MRRVFEERNIEQGYNSFKYFLVVVAVCLGMAYEVDRKKDRQTIWRWSGGVTSAMAVVFCTYWDLVQDWGLLNRTSKNPWLRDELLVPHKEVYFIAMVKALKHYFKDCVPSVYLKIQRKMASLAWVRKV